MPIFVLQKLENLFFALVFTSRGCLACGHTRRHILFFHGTRSTSVLLPNTGAVNFGDSPPLATRSGWMSIACLPFVLVLAAKENPISFLTGVSHEQLMVFHRWAAWAMFVLALIHTFPFIVYHMSQGDIVTQWQTSVFWWTGVVALLAQAWLQFMSLGFIRWVVYFIYDDGIHLTVPEINSMKPSGHCIILSWQFSGFSSSFIAILP